MAQPSALESDYFISNSQITTVYLNRLAKMSKHPNVESELSQVLDDFLEKLGECDKYLQNGIFNMNFAEAALLIQSSADLYGKKVDLLWDIIFDYQKRLVLSEQDGDKNQEIEKVEERKRKYRRKRKTNADDSQTAKLVNDFSFGATQNVNYLNQSHEIIDLSEEWKKFDTETTACDSVELVPNKSFIFQPNTSVYNEDNDYIGRYNQFHSMSLTEEIFHLESQKLLSDDYNCITSMRIDSYLINDFLLEKSISINTPPEMYECELKEHINQFLESNKPPNKKPSSESQQSQCRKSNADLQRVPVDIVTETLRRGSLADSLFDDDQLESEMCSTPCFNDTKSSASEGNKNLENRSKSCSQDSAFYEDEEPVHNDSEVEADSALETTIENVLNETEKEGENDAPVAPGITTNVIETVAEKGHCDSAVVGSELLVSSQKEDSTSAIVASEELVSSQSKAEDANLVSEKLVTNEKPKETTITTRCKAVKRWSCLLEEPEDEEQKVKKRKAVKKIRISAKALEKLATGITVKYRDFESFCRLQYKPANDEGVVPPQLSDSEDSNEEDNLSDNDDDDHEDITPIHTEEETSDHEDAENADDEEPAPDPPETTSPDFNLPSSGLMPLGLTSTPNRPESVPIPSFPISEIDFEHEDSCRRNVREWQSFIVPKLKKLENRADFDIHEYGAKIIQPSEVGQHRHFKDVVRGKSAAEVARYFIATLQLANTYNVEIVGAGGGGVANDTFEIKTLDKTKHHELLEEYQAPSEETFRERLERAEAMKPGGCLGGEPSTKKRKIGNYSRGVLF